MAIRKRILALSAALAIAFAASAIQAATVQRLLIPGGVSELPIGQKVLVIQAQEDVALVLYLDGDIVSGTVEKVRPGGSDVNVRISWKVSKLTVVEGLVDAPLDFSTSLHKETGHGEM